MVTHPNRARKATVSSGTIRNTAVPVHDHDRDYADLLAAVQRDFDAATTESRHLFCTDVTGLWEAYLNVLPGELAIHNCSTCRRFINRFGGLVTLDTKGQPRSALWADAPAYYVPAVRLMQRKVERARVTGPFLSKDMVWGTPETGKWTHFSVDAAHVLYKHATLTPGQAMAAKREDFKTVETALSEWNPETLDYALQMLHSEMLNRSEKFVAPVQWLRDLHTVRAETKNRNERDNLLWLAVAGAPAGFCHPRAGVIGSLMEDIEAKLVPEQIVRRFGVLTNSLAYQRPKAPPKAGNIEAAEKLIEKMGLAPALERRYARLDEVLPHATWQAPVIKVHPQPAAAGRVFAHLTPNTPVRKGTVTNERFPIVITWSKFAEVVLPRAGAIHLRAPGHGAFIALATAVNPDAPRLFKWENPFNWYVYPAGSSASQWNVSPLGWTQVNAVVPLPNLWGRDPQPHLSEGVVLVLEGCADGHHVGASLFPEILRGELHEVRSTIEAFSRSAKMDGQEAASACGYDLRKGQQINVLVRVSNGPHMTDYRIDRWD